MRISIVTISYNQGRFLEECIQSVLQQAYPDIEYIVVDPGSVDGSRAIIERYRDRIDKIVFEPDEGPAAGLNKGFSRATGEIYAYLNADDLLLGGSVARMAEEFGEDQDADVIAGHGHVVDEHGELLWREFSWPFSLASFVAGCGTVVQQSTFFRSGLFKMTNGFNIDNRTCWDAELLVDIALSGGKFRVINAFIGAFRLHPESISGSGRLEKVYIKDVERIRARVGAQLSRPRARFYCILNKLRNPWAAIARVVDTWRSAKGRRKRRNRGSMGVAS